MRTYLLLISILIVKTSFLIGQSKDVKIFIKDFDFIDDRIEVKYGFENYQPYDKFMVWIQAKTESGKIFQANSLEGNINNVIPSPDLKLIWNTADDGIIIEEKTEISINAILQPEVKYGKAIAASTLFPGAGHRFVGGKNKIYLGILGYAGIAGTLAFNNMAATSLSEYNLETDPVKSKKLYNDAEAFKNYSYACIGVSAVVWGLNYLLLANHAKHTKNIKPQQIIIDPPKNFKRLIANSEMKYISTRGLPPNLFADLLFKDQNTNGILEADEVAEISITVSNKGKGNALNMLVKLMDDKPDASLEIGPGKHIPILRPNQDTTLIFKIKAGNNIQTTNHKIEIRVTENYGYDMDPAFLNLQTLEYQKAQLAFSGIEILDAGEGTAAIVEDGQLQAGEMIKAKVVIQNIGQGISSNTKYAITCSDNNIFLRNNTGILGTLYPGEVRELYITISPNKRVQSKDNLPIFIDLQEDKGKGNLLAYQLPVKLDKKPPETNIVTVNADIGALTKNIAVFEYKSNKFTANTGTTINIRSVVPSRSKRQNAIAVVFGVSQYENIAPAPYADNDAYIMKDYFEKVLGIGQVIYFTNEEVTISKLNKIFNPNYGELQKAIVKGQTDVFVFFSGHGIPDKTGTNTYLFPYDGVKEDLESFGYNTSKLYENLNKLEARSVTVILDACFSGSSRGTEKIREENLLAQKGVRVKTSKPWLAYPNFTVINSSVGEETSLGYDPSETGLFTYFLTAGLQGKADENRDKNVTFGELKKYVTENVTTTSTKLIGLQTPEFFGEDRNVMVEY